MARFLLVCLILLPALCATAQNAERSTLPGGKSTEFDLLTPLPLDWLEWTDETSVIDDDDPSSRSAHPLSEIDRAPGSSGSGQSESLVRNAVGSAPDAIGTAVERIPSFIPKQTSPHRIVRYDVPLADSSSQQILSARGLKGELIEVPVAVDVYERSTLGRLKVRMQGLFGLLGSKDYPKKARVIRYEVPADDIALHTTLADLDGELIEPGLLRLPEVRFFQPKARVFMDLKRRNDQEFDLFSNGAILASLDVVELYFPMPLFTERFDRLLGRPSRLSRLGWRVGGTVGVGITTALNNGEADNGSAPISTLSSGLRYEFPLGRPPMELIQTGDPRFDQRTRVGIEAGVQGGISTNESLADSTDVGFYIGILVNTPWSSYGS